MAGCTEAKLFKALVNDRLGREEDGSSMSCLKRAILRLDWWDTHNGQCSTRELVRMPRNVLQELPSKSLFSYTPNTHTCACVGWIEELLKLAFNSFKLLVKQWPCVNYKPQLTQGRPFNVTCVARFEVVVLYHLIYRCNQCSIHRGW